MSNAPAFLLRNLLTSTNELSAKRTAYTTVTGSSGVASMVGVCRPNRDGFLTVQKSSDGVTWTDVQVLYFAKVRTAAVVFPIDVSSNWRVVFDEETEVAVLKLGEALRMTQNNYQGVTPPMFNQSHNKTPSTMNRGQWLGRQTHGRIAKSAYKTDKTKMAFVRTDVMEMVEELREGAGVFYMWRPEKYPQDSIYGHLSGEISPANAGLLDFMQFDITIEGQVDSQDPTYDKPTVTVPV